MKWGVPEGFGRELHPPVPVLKKITLSAVEEELEAGQTSYKGECCGSGGGPLGEHGGSSFWGRVKIQLELVTDWR